MVFDISRYDDKVYVSSYIREALVEVLNWTTLICDWRSVDVEIPYNLVFSSRSKPWGYRYRMLSDGEMRLIDVSTRSGLETVLVSLITNFCTTKYKNGVDGRDTLYRFVPQAKRGYRG